MSYARKLLTLRSIVALIAFFLSWLILTVGGLLINKEEILKWLAEQNWIKFLNPKISNFLFVYGWQVAISIILSVLIFRLTKEICIKLLNIYLISSPKISLIWGDSEHGLPASEALLFFDTGCESCTLILKNSGAKDLKITRMEIQPAVYKRVSGRSGNEVTVRVSDFQFNAGNQGKNGLEWKPDQKDKWYIENTITINQNSKFELPILDPTFNDEDTEIVENISKLVSDPTLRVEYDLVVYTDEMPYKLSSGLPLRILRPYEDWDDEFNDAKELVNNLGINDLHEKDKLIDIYTNVAREMFEIRSKIAENLTEWQEQERLQELEEQIRPYDRKIEKNPNSGEAHYSRGHALIELGFTYEALFSIDNAMNLGLTTPELLLDRALLLLQSSKPYEALESLYKIEKEWQPNALFYELRAQAYDDLKYYNEALVDYNCLIELEPDVPEHYIRRALAITSISKENGEAALTSIRDAINKGFAEKDVLLQFQYLIDEESVPKLKELVDSLKEKTSDQLD